MFSNSELAAKGRTKELPYLSFFNCCHFVYLVLLVIQVTAYSHNMSASWTTSNNFETRYGTLCVMTPYMFSYCRNAEC